MGGGAHSTHNGRFTDVKKKGRGSPWDAHRCHTSFQKRRSTLLKSKVDLMTYYVSNPLYKTIP